jgi:hypothetical protein
MRANNTAKEEVVIRTRGPPRLKCTELGTTREFGDLALEDIFDLLPDLHHCLHHRPDHPAGATMPSKVTPSLVSPTLRDALTI